MNNATFIGNLTADAKQHQGADGRAFVTFDIAINYRRRGTNAVMYVSCFRTGDNARLLPYLTKGQKVCVVGPVSVTAYTAGNGDARATLNVLVTELELVGGRALVNPSDMAEHTMTTTEQKSAPTTEQSSAVGAPTAKAPTKATDEDDLPF